MQSLNASVRLVIGGDSGISIIGSHLVEYQIPGSHTKNRILFNNEKLKRMFCMVYIKKDFCSDLSEWDSQTFRNMVLKSKLISP